jgi:hypothetical protein
MKMTRIDEVLALAEAGFHVFPLRPGTKLPAIEKFPERATRDPDQIRKWWSSRDYNVGISTTRFGDAEALIVVDVDNKGDKHGDETILRLEIGGADFPATRTTRTPTGGRHLIYRAAQPVKQGVGVLGEGLDVRSRGGYVVGPGSTIDGVPYQTEQPGDAAPVPEWLVERLGGAARPSVDKRTQDAPDGAVDPERAMIRAREYLARLESATAGERNDAGYRVACQLKDFGLPAPVAEAVMAESWKCEPMLDDAELAAVVASAYRYGQEPLGSAAPEVEFKPVHETPVFTNGEQPENVGKPADPGHPFTRLNDEFAFCITGGDYAILWETADYKGRPVVQYLSPGAFKTRFAGVKLAQGDKQIPITRAWLEWEDRRSYDGIVFAPGYQVPPRFYNLWRGFTVDPDAPCSDPDKAAKALTYFLEHLRENVCHGVEPLRHWLTSYFAHMIQKPQDKPLVALVFRGDKGVGKNALVERIGFLLGAHFAVADDSRYLTGQFNSHLENNLFLVFDEAFWSGDKKAEGRLKGLITGTEHLIERKGYEPYKVANLSRIAIIGNEDWLVPASHDERRYAVFSVGDKRKQDRAFFQLMREGMEAGGYSLLLRYLLDYDIKGVDVNRAPDTDALLDQKIASLGIIAQWWFESLQEGAIVGADFEGWPAKAECERFRAAFRRYCKDHNVRGRIPPANVFGIELKRYAGAVHRRARGAGSVLQWIYDIPPLEEARAAWETFIGQKMGWA